jgi:hypothetical protein
VRQSLAPDGLQATLLIPLTHERWPGRITREDQELP